VVRKHGAIVAAGALQRFDSSALVRSVVVAADRRGTGLGRLIAQELENIASATRVNRLILLTQTAREFFAYQGYRVIERSQVPQDIQGSEEFRSLCPASATCMIKVLTLTHSE
jgi:amino-acid N-acetyltransferase